MAIIEFINVSKYYGKKPGILNASFKIEEGDIVIFEGHNGSGKTTTIKLILGLLFLKKRDSGKIIKDKKSYSYLPEKMILPPFIQSKEFISDILKSKGKIDDIDLYFDWFNLSPNELIGGLSKGMRQKLGIIQLVISDADVLVLDEPLSGLDDMAVSRVIEMLGNLARKGKTIIISTHNKAAFIDISNKVMRFQNHEIISFGNT